MIGWKKCVVMDKHGSLVYGDKNNPFRKTVLVKLEILGVTITNGTALLRSVRTNKCRTSKAKVLLVEGLARGEKAISWFDSGRADRSSITTYKKGAIVEPRDVFHVGSEACASGIHFFKTKKEAKEYDFS